MQTDLFSVHVPQFEFAAAKNYSSTADASAFLTTRFYLRKILSTFLNVDPITIKLSYSKMGKPYLPESDVHFNISHSNGVFAIGVALGTEIGVDVEYLRREIDISKMQGVLFTQDEQKIIANCNQELTKQLFIDLWTRKEAILKAYGSGLSQPMNEFSLLENDFSDTGDYLVRFFKNAIWKLESRNVFENYRLSVAFKCSSSETTSDFKSSFLEVPECTL